MKRAFPFGFWRGSSFSPALLTLAVYLDASKAGYNAVAGTWAGQASAGVSATQSLAMIGAPNLTAGSLNGFATAISSNAIGSYLATPSVDTTLLPSGTFTYFALLRLTATPAHNVPAGATPYMNDSMIATDNRSGITAYSSGPGIDSYAYDGAFRDNSVGTMTVNTWYFVWATLDGTHLSTSINGAAVQQVANGDAIFNGVNGIAFGGGGSNTSSAEFAMIGVAPSALATGVRDQLRAYSHSKFGVTV